MSLRSGEKERQVRLWMTHVEYAHLKTRANKLGQTISGRIRVALALLDGHEANQSRYAAARDGKTSLSEGINKKLHAKRAERDALDDAKTHDIASRVAESTYEPTPEELAAREAILNPPPPPPSPKREFKNGRPVFKKRNIPEPDPNDENYVEILPVHLADPRYAAHRPSGYLESEKSLMDAPAAPPPPLPADLPPEFAILHRTGIQLRYHDPDSDYAPHNPLIHVPKGKTWYKGKIVPLESTPRGKHLVGE